MLHSVKLLNDYKEFMKYNIQIEDDTEIKIFISINEVLIVIEYNTEYF